MGVRIDGKAVAAKVKARTAAAAKTLPRKPGLAVILVGDNPASRIYVTGKEKDCAECGFESFEYTMPADTSQETLLALIHRLNQQEEVDGILVQLPLPDHLDAKEVLYAIDPSKDVDCFHPFNVGRLSMGDAMFQPCTPSGIMELLEEYGVDVDGKRCVILGRSNIVGKPMGMLLLQHNATVTICHSHTKDLASYTRQADVLVSAVGQRGLVTADMVKEGAVVIDVAMNRKEDGKLCGDVEYEEVARKASFITPVPGGVGPMTRAVLMENILEAAKHHLK